MEEEYSSYNHNYQKYKPNSSSQNYQSIEQNQIQEIQNQLPNQINIPKNRFRSAYYNDYLSYFSAVEHQTEIIINQSLKNITSRIQHRLILLNQNQKSHSLISFKKPIIYILANLYGGLIIKYNVVIGNYKLELDLLNLNFQSPGGLNEIDSGSFGKIYKINYDQEKFMVCKRIYFTQDFKSHIDVKQYMMANKYEIDAVICQYAIYKICSFYQIGPNTISEFGFDLVCFFDSIEFYLEECQRIPHRYQNLENQLKIVVRCMHKFKLIHKDIKPANILYSKKYKKIVLCDFGISHSIQEQLGDLSKTYQQGSRRFMGPQMSRIREGTAYIDLYYNDLCGLKIALQDYIRCFQKIDEVNVIQEKYKQNQKNIYIIIHYFYHLVNNNKQKTNKFVKHIIDAKFPLIQLFLKHILNQDIKIMLKQLLDKETIKKFYSILQINTDNKQQKQKIYNLIRCYGMTDLLSIELKSFTKSKLIERLQKKINSCVMQKNLQYWYNLKILRKITPLELKLEKEIESIEKQKDSKRSNELLSLYFNLFDLKIRNPSNIKKNLQNIVSRIKDAYSTREIDQKYEEMILLVDIFNYINAKKNYKKKLRAHIQKYPSRETEIYAKIINFCQINQKIVYYLKMLVLFEKDQQTNLQKICDVLNQIIFITPFNNKQCNTKEVIRHHLVKFQESVRLLLDLNKNTQKYTLNIKINFYLGNIQFLKNNYQNAIKYYRQNQIMEIVLNGNVSLARVQVLTRLGFSYFKLNKYDQAIQIIKLTLLIYKTYFKQSLYYHPISACYLYLSIIYLNKSNFDNMKQYIDLYSYEQNKIKFIEEYGHIFSDANIHDLQQQSMNQLKNIIREIKSIKEVKYWKVEDYERTYIKFSYIYHCYKKKMNLIHFLKKKYKTADNQILFSQLQQSISHIFQQLKLVFQFLLSYLLQFHIILRGNKNLLQQCLIFQNFNDDYNTVSRIMMFSLYGIILHQYELIKQFQCCHKYLKKQFKLMKIVKQFNISKILMNLIQNALALQKYFEGIYFIRYSLSRLCLSNQDRIILHKNQAVSYLRLFSSFKFQKRYTQYLKLTTWKINSYYQLAFLYFKNFKLQKLVILNCYSLHFLKNEISIQIRKNTVVQQKFQARYSICEKLFTQKQQHQEFLIGRLEIIKKCLVIKRKMGCLKYIKVNNMKQEKKKVIQILR